MPTTAAVAVGGEDEALGAATGLKDAGMTGSPGGALGKWRATRSGPRHPRRWWR
jgi:hypothetical protein